MFSSYLSSFYYRGWQSAATKIGQAIYGNNAGGGEGDAAAGPEGAEGSDKENVQDAEFEEKTEEEDKGEKKSQ